MKTYRRAFGDYGEDLAVKYLLKNKYNILARNYASHDGEIDIIAIETKSSRKLDEDYNKMSDIIRNEDVLCFIEVKTRSTTEFGKPFESVDKNKENRYYNLSNKFIFANHLENYQIRYDIIEIVGDKINQIKNAF